MKVHVLPGDALAEDFKNSTIEGEIIVCRECLVDGDVKAESLEDFWQTRATFITNSYGGNEKEYFSGVVAEFEKLKTAALARAEINLWFEYELFCQVNLWFCLYFLRETGTRIFRVAPVVRQKEDIWKGFGRLEAGDLEKCLAKRIEFSENDLLLGADLWQAYQNADYEKLEKLSENESQCFPFLREVCRAEIEKATRPRRALQEIIASGKEDFAEIFPAFSAQMGVYGFGDTQVQRILSEI